MMTLRPERGAHTSAPQERGRDAHELPAYYFYINSTAYIKFYYSVRSTAYARW